MTVKTAIFEGMKGIFLNKNLGILLLVIAVFIVRNPLLSQGCSDAGVCSIGGHGKMEKGSLTLNTQYGVGEQGVQYFTNQLEGVLRLNSKYTLQLKAPYTFINGNLGSNNGWGDIILVGNRNIYDKNEKKMSLSLGVRVGVNNASKYTANQLLDYSIALPMPYQTSLGTHDLLLGADLEYKEKWRFSLGVQIPLIQFNKNGFDTARISPGSDRGDKARQYFSSYHLIRRPDIVFRVDRTFKITKKLKFTAGLLPIYHLLHDRYTDINGVERAIHGSKGLTLNIPVAAAYKFNSKWTLTARFASPVIVREVRPDGLTRQFVSSIELKYTF